MLRRASTFDPPKARECRCLSPRSAQRASQRPARTQALLNFFTNIGKKPAKISQATKLLELVSETNLGSATSPDLRAEILDTVEELCALQSGQPTTGTDLSATWKMAWTTEKETLFILNNAKWFGTEAGDVFQVIDVEEGSLQNVITFPPEGAFLVESSLEVAGDQRTNFKFSGAKLKLPNRVLNIPPFGKGWFDTVYLDENVRVAKDIRGDTLITTRDGPPRSFL